MKHKIKILLILIISIFIFKQDIFATTYKRGIITSSYTIRTSPSSNAPYLKNDTNKNISLGSPEPVEILSESGTFYQIKFCHGGFFYTGWIPKSKVTAKTYTTDDAYEQNLISQGFPADYAKKLAILHAIHPNWSFTPSFTGNQAGGLDFNTAVNGESDPVKKNLTNSTNTTLRSTEDGAYKNGVWTEFEAGWYAASKQTIAFFLDPRNFLDEAEIFMFENFGYNPNTQKKENVNKILNGTFMQNPFECGEHATTCNPGTHYYVDSFMESGIDHKISPVHLAARVKQEQGTNGSTLSLGKGYNGQYIGYYNFFNIGATGTTTSEVILNGLAYAKNKNWNNQHASIYGGAYFLSKNYISRGQSTKYYQKFNTIAPSYYGNQYMQNVKAPFSEAYTVYTSYYKFYNSLDAWDKAEHEFLIPIYKNMPAYTSLDVSGNGDATLRSLEIQGCNLNPSFQSSAYYYDCYASKQTTEINISAATTNGGAKLENPGKVILNSDEQTTNIKVTAVNGTSATYTINIKRIDTDGVSPSDILNGIGLKVNENFVYNINVGSDISSITNDIKNKYHYATVKVKDSNGKEISDGTVKTGLTITINNAGTEKSFKTVIYGDPAGDGTIDILDLLIVQKHLVKAKTLSGEYFTAADVNHDGKVDILDLLLIQKYLLNQYTITQE